MNRQKYKILHDLKRIANTMKLLEEELNRLYEDVEEVFKEEGGEGGEESVGGVGGDKN